MQLSDLKTGMIVTTRNGKEYVVCKDAVCANKADCGTVFIDSVTSSWHKASNYLEDMRYHEEEWTEFDIVKVELPVHPYGYMDLKFEPTMRTVIWERNDVLEVTMAEVEAKFGCKVKIVKEK